MKVCERGTVFQLDYTKGVTFPAKMVFKMISD